ncbi:MAG TPA: DUF4383 domain-containing protein [Baekduia sp.]|nr:DUF4383 domain-containing protein [Baekduia sp.]
MSSAGARRAGASAVHAGADAKKRGLTPAQWFSLVVGGVLLLVGVLGFIADASFDTTGTVDTDAGGNAGGNLQGDGFLGLEVNGWHNIVHIASGAFLLLMARKRRTAKLGTIAFGAIYGLVTIIGLIDGEDVLGFIPVNAADNVLHVLLSAGSLLAGLVSRGDEPSREVTARQTTTSAGEMSRSARFGRDPAATAGPRESDRTGSRRP